MQDWWTPADLAEAGLPDMPNTARAIQLMADRGGWRAPEHEYPANPRGRWRRREGRGGGYEYHVVCLPRRARAALALRAHKAAPAPARDDRAVARDTLARAEAWAWFEGLPERKKAEAREKLDALLAVDTLVRTGEQRDLASIIVARDAGVTLRTLYNWRERVANTPREDWLPALAARHAGRTSEVACPDAAWDALQALYLRPEQPNFTSCYRDLEKMAQTQGWTLPSAKTLLRRLQQLPVTKRVLLREGIEALKRLYPAQRRDRSMLHALEGVNADGHKWDVFVRWPDGTIGRPVTAAFQDLYSGKFLAWRTARSENTATVLLAFGDMAETYGLPDWCVLDNGRNFASKWLTGGTPNRYRFKVREGDPEGVLTTLGVEIHWTQPYSGQSKPIERGFRDFAQEIAKDIRFAGAWTGNTIDAKPENYASTAVPIDLFEAVIAERIAEHNARPGRRSKVCGGKLSFDVAFAASYQDAPIRRVREEHKRLWLLAAEGIGVRRQDGSLHFEGNRYWADALLELLGSKVIVRFDPDDLHAGLHVYRLDNSFICHAPCVEDVGFRSRAEGQAANRARKTWLRAQKEAAQTRYSLDELVALMPAAAPAPETPEPKVVRPVAWGNTARAVATDADAERDEMEGNFARAMQRLRLVRNEGDADL